MPVKGVMSNFVEAKESAAMWVQQRRSSDDPGTEVQNASDPPSVFSEKTHHFARDPIGSFGGSQPTILKEPVQRRGRLVDITGSEHIFYSLLDVSATFRNAEIIGTDQQTDLL